ncbi:diguanylate cyclase [Clostridium gasigenes]|uniref:bifunctional diguanylate cyclase/phosphohydrolase n=1 Tax=Clostridium gasigenes TaxID=94869 RepID=UPI0016262DFD|nr:diguanylate cyclase [Clostridium gasigenes]MBB6622294.1 diguanylate cyclase [Clostridium gasigenes]MBU3087074.1 diguanylate cyclase [Clostridium gasigenes]MBU3131108.1 diguanylate cyclase [Clostridium gasigenes]
MNKIENNKRKQINDIVSVVKLSSLMVTTIIFFQYYFKNNMFTIDYIYNSYGFQAGAMGAVLLFFVYFIWSCSFNKKISEKNINYAHFIENTFFILVFIIAIMISGAHLSESKYIFLFIITTSTIQSGMKNGVTIACISSLIILAIDLIYAPNLVVNEYFQNDLILSGVFLLTAWPLGFYVKVEGEHIKKLEGLANEDGLTGVYNHRYFQDALKTKIEMSNRLSQPISMIFIDIDYFKHYNDLYGHQKGDEVLKSIGKILRENIRKEDIVARYGGEEFAVLLPNIKENEAIIIADNIRGIIESTKFYGEENQPKGKLTVSMGVSVYPDKCKTEIELIKSADDALYRAKFFNKNRVETYTSILDGLKNDIDDKDVELVASIKTLISVINAKDKYTYAHSERLVFYSRLLAHKLNLSKIDTDTLVYGAYMHDIGKINISKEILIKKMPLTKEEWELLKEHPQNGIDIIKPVQSLEKIVPLILHHHENYNGTGYPNKLKGEDIPYLARVLTVVDSFDAMTSNRPYNKRKTYEEAVEELIKFSGAQFDPKIVKTFIQVIEENKDSLDSLD